MFGHQDNHHDEHQQPEADGILEHQDNLHPHDEGHINPAVPDDVDNFGAPSDDAQDNTVTPAVSGGQPVPANDDVASPAADNVISTGPDDDLLNIKTQALQQLTPLVGHLDQTPEEKFRTTMMMIQASDNQGLVKIAYEAARQISDEKAKAQALLDIVNEINYFTHQGNSEA